MSRPQPLVLFLNPDDFVCQKLGEVLSQKNLMVANNSLEGDFTKADYLVLFEEEGLLNFLEIVTKGPKTSARTLFITSLFGKDYRKNIKTFADFCSENNLNGRAVILGDVYGPKVPINTPLGKAFSQLVLANTVDSSTNLEVYPVYINDAVWGIEKCLFSGGTSGHQITLAGQPTNFDEFLSTLSSIKPYDLKTGLGEFDRPTIAPAQLRRGRELINWEPHTSLFEGLTSTVIWFQTHKEGLEVEEKTPKKILNTENFWEEERERKVKRDSRMKPKKVSTFGFVSTLALVLAFYIFIFPFIQYGLGLINLKQASAKFTKKEYKDVYTWANTAKFWFKNSQDGLDLLRRIPILGEEADEIAVRSRQLGRASNALGQGGLVSIEAGELMGKIFGKNDFDVSGFSSSLYNRISLLEQDLAFLEAETSQTEKLSKEAAGYFSDVQLSQLRAKLHSTLGVLGSLPDLLGTTQEKTYLVLVFDEAELRPGGGFIGVYGLVTVNKGRIISSEFQNSQMADSQLVGHIEPPSAIKENLGEKSWYLRDSAWSGDFPSNAQKAIWFIEKELSIKTDGVLSIDITLLNSLLSTTGPITVPSVGTVDSKNLQKTLNATQTAGKPALASIVQKVFERSGQLMTEKSALFIGKIVDGLDRKHGAVYLGEQFSNSLSLAGWGGGILDSTCKYAQVCQKDYLYFVEANLGINKANMYLARSFNLEVDLGGDNVGHKLTVNLENSGGSDWPAGEYKNYFRAYIPINATNLFGILVDPQDTKTEEVSLGEGVEKARKVVGGLVVVPPREQRQLVLTWSTQKVANFSEYSLLWQKQAGTGPDPVYLNITGKEARVVSTSPPASLTRPGTIGYNTELKRDLKVNIKWQ